MQLLGIDRRTVTCRIADLVSEGTVEPARALRGRNQAYRLADEGIAHDRIQ